MTTSTTLTLSQLLVELAQNSIKSDGKNINDSYNIFYTTATKNTVSEFSTIPNSTRLLNHEDPFNYIKSHLANDKLNTIFTNELTILKALPHLLDSSFQGKPIVINIDLDLQDYSVIPSLKDLPFSIFISNDSNEIIENSKLIQEITINSLIPILHFINYKKINQLQKHIPFNENDFQQFDSIPNEPETFDFQSEPANKFFNLFVPNDSENKPSTLLINLSPYHEEFKQNLPSNDVALLSFKIYRPWNLSKLLSIIPSSIRKFAIIQGAAIDTTSNTTTSTPTSTFQPLLLDFFSDFNLLVEKSIDQLIVTNVGILTKDFKDTLEIIVNNVKKQNPIQSLFLGKSNDLITEIDSTILSSSSSLSNVQNLENAYLKVLRQLFNSNLNILNEYSSETVQANNPEFGFGNFLQNETVHSKLLSLAKKSLDPSLYNSTKANEIVQLLSKWIGFHDKKINLNESKLLEANEIAHQLFDLLQSNQDSQTALNFLQIAPTIDQFLFKSNWLIGSDAWSYDLGHSGIHQVLASQKNINVLLIDSEPYDVRKSSPRSKKDVGLYAMNFNDVYVASVAVYSSYTQLLTAIIEASQFNGPSIVLAYLPYHSENDTPIEILKETKNGVESGYWPLYRYNPSKEDIENEDVFKLDSSVIRNELQKFLDRENKLTLLAEKDAQFARDLKNSETDIITQKQERRAKAAFDELLEGLSGPPLHIYYASDGGNGTNLAKRLANRAAARGLKATALSMDDIILEDLPGEENVIFITSTAGQGEFPQDGKAFWDNIKSSTDLDLNSLNVAVFGLGDSMYWPRKEDKHYFNKPAKDLYKRLELLTANPIAPIGLGDDQDADGYQTAYEPFENAIWEFFGVDNVAVEDEPKPWTNEDMKINSDFLRGTIVESIADPTTGNIHPYDAQLTKFHGCYMQDDRDIRDIRKAQGLEPLYSFMSRIRLPGGQLTPEQWLAMDKISSTVGNGTMKVTTRATFQLHGIIKQNMKHAIRAMNSVLLDTLAACGDVNRNVVVTALPANAKVHTQVAKMGANISEYFLPKTTAYHEIWLEGLDDRDDDKSWPETFANRKEGPRKKKTLVSGNALVDIEPIYGPTYLPRKFKVNIAVPPYNDVDVFSSDIGLIAILDEATHEVIGYNMYAGGGMGTTHNNKKTYPRTGSLLGFVKPEDVIPAIQSVMIIQRDSGDRKERKHARLKYTIDDMGNDVFREKVEEGMGKKFGPERPYEFKSNIDYFGWVKDETGLNHFTAFIENGRIVDTPDAPQKTGLRKVAELLQKNKSGQFRLTANQHVLISNIEDQHLDGVKAILKAYQLDNNSLSALRLGSSSCVGLPTCGLAMAESERYLPVLITQIEDILEEYGLRHDSVIMRMTGCANGCSRPWLAELALIGKAPHTYNLMLGGGYYGQRINKLYRASVKDDDILDILKPLFKRWALEREEGEHFGDFLIRVGIVNATTEGKYFHDDIKEDAY
ncbi:sulfite reductase (NADPH) subunit beta NDAI_0J03030 [Naumovozyma dairenensis CBS 421]|uniref:Sulfite reductase [NADPH] subunit beta n=1 Tax=Naumovozyma dairenensis (strain ATCC 10597 / BCRC 20456 / CBS 421 / NBRC 0211 / NRRL Y-12639) TaxID=1071378 RepID=G0WHB7_NAUDC|nr:hypothetical protein NDAI_0J03030 [Naumovozyma dairenensis CBS 421]CCD27195.1 hypothetical protein NDAI_0J03030 [Naumovozyma dairenensis CBS 421]